MGLDWYPLKPLEGHETKLSQLVAEINIVGRKYREVAITEGYSSDSYRDLNSRLRELFRECQPRMVIVEEVLGYRRLREREDFLDLCRREFAEERWPFIDLEIEKRVTEMTFDEYVEYRGEFWDYERGPGIDIPVDVYFPAGTLETHPLFRGTELCEQFYDRMMPSEAREFMLRLEDYVRTRRDPHHPDHRPDLMDQALQEWMKDWDEEGFWFWIDQALKPRRAERLEKGGAREGFWFWIDQALQWMKYWTGEGFGIWADR